MNRETMQRRISGYADQPYHWQDRSECRRDRRPAYEPRESREAQYKRHLNYRNAAVMYATLILVVAVLVIGIYKVSEINSQRKQINAIYEEIKTLTAEIEGLEVELCMETRPSIIKQKAGTIGMVTPAENEVCVLRTVVKRTTDTAQTAENVTRAR